MGLFNFFTKEKKEDLDKGLEKTKEGFFARIAKVFVGKSKIDEEVLDRELKHAQPQISFHQKMKCTL